MTALTLSADFETTTDADDCRVWSWGTCDISNPTDETFTWGTDIGSFMSWIADRNSVTYFHNLAFDGSFILDWLLKNGYRYTSDRPRRSQFTSLIDRHAKFYTITVHWVNGCRTEFRDSLKLLPLSIGAIAATFKLDMAKGELDYNKPRPMGYVPDSAELDYLKRDVLILGSALKQTFEEGTTKLTIGSASLAEYKSLVDKKWFSRTFPILSPAVDADIRAAYRGGWTYVNPRYRGKVVGPGMVFDVNSLYPSVMYDRVLPWGTPQFQEYGIPEITDEWPLFIVSLTFTARIKPGHLPCIQVKKSAFLLSTEYQTEITEPVTLACTNVDLALWLDHYDMDILSVNGAWRFHGTAGMFSKYIDKWSAIKAESDGGRKFIAKLHLNSLYGKFATNPDVQGKVPILDDTGTVRLIMGPAEERDPVYTPVGVFITAYARNVTIRAAQANFATFAYADTDSLHLVTDTVPTTLDVDPKRLGAWKHELSFSEAVFLRAKQYCEFGCAPGEDEPSFHTHIAGLPRPIAEKLTIADILHGNMFTGKLVPHRVPGGIVLRETTFRLTVVEDSS